MLSRKKSVLSNYVITSPGLAVGCLSGDNRFGIGNVLLKRAGVYITCLFFDLRSLGVFDRLIGLSLREFILLCFIFRDLFGDTERLKGLSLFGYGSFRLSKVTSIFSKN